MAQVIISESIQQKTSARQRLTAEQELALVAQVKERNELLKRKKDSFTLEEQRIRIKGERAFNALVDGYRNLIWSLVYRFKVSNRIAYDDMYQAAVKEIDRAVNTHNPKKIGKQAKFSTWVCIHIRSKFITLFRDEYRFVSKNEAFCNNLINTNHLINEQTPLKVAIKGDFREQIEQTIKHSLSEKQSTTVIAHFLEGERLTQIALKLGESTECIEKRSSNGSKLLRTNPRLQELAQVYFS